MRSCKTVAKIELCSKSLARHLVAAPRTFCRCFHRLYAACHDDDGGGIVRRRAKRRRETFFWQRVPWSRCLRRWPSLPFFLCMHVCVCMRACVIRGHILYYAILNIIIYLYFSCHFFPIPFGRGAAAAHISILRCYYYTTSKIPNPLKKNKGKEKNVSCRCSAVAAAATCRRETAARPGLYIYIIYSIHARIYDRTLRNRFCVSLGVWCFKTSSVLCMYQLGHPIWITRSGFKCVCVWFLPIKSKLSIQSVIIYGTQEKYVPIT